MKKKDSTKLFEGQTIYIGIDTHMKSWKVTIIGEHYHHKTYSQNPEPDFFEVRSTKMVIEPLRVNNRK